MSILGCGYARAKAHIIPVFHHYTLHFTLVSIVTVIFHVCHWLYPGSFPLTACEREPGHETFLTTIKDWVVGPLTWGRGNWDHPRCTCHISGTEQFETLCGQNTYISNTYRTCASISRSSQCRIRTQTHCLYTTLPLASPSLESSW